MDARDWLSYGTVDDKQPVVFDPDFGPLVNVQLQPSQKLVPCRVGMRVAGNGEAEYYPFVAGDEVLVAIPEGNERAGCVILCRLNNSIDKFPSDSVAGQDPTTNSFGFVRTRAPVVNEAVGPWFQRQASTEALFGFDAKGAITLKDGGGSALNLTHDALTYISADSALMLQLDLTGKRFTLQVDDALMVLSSSSSTPSPPVNAITVPGALTLSTATSAAAEHATTTEAVANILAQLLPLMGPFLTTALAAVVTPAPGAPLGPLISAAIVAALAIPVTVPTLVSGALAAASQAPLDPTLATALFGLFQSAQPKPAGVPGQGQLKPGVGVSGLLVG